MTSNLASLQRCLDLDLGLGESPVWDDRTNTLFFVDILAPALYRYHPDSGDVQRWDMPETIGSFGLCDDGRIVAALRSGVYLFDLETEVLELLAQPEPDRPENRLNDGKIGPDGAFWIGSMNDTADKTATAALYRVTMDGTVTQITDGLIISNGLAWSPDGTTMYHSDSRAAILWAYDFDISTGSATNRRAIKQFSGESGRPDGGAVDVEGGYWSAGVFGSRLNRIAANGTLLRRVDLGIPAPTMPCFAGDDLRTLYLTSLRTEQDGVVVPGGLYRLEGGVGVAGVPVHRFGAKPSSD
ncbi:SMP-30/gluconolactonase/LRE family protein [Pseudoruegeria sp. SK021]|uniref:SMP-30/gluconolactonase/LRE family protein n=1 Tax=Pseudoruegeria sp. SK021 TaxID=1933035 RepID=UPI000A264AAB|nr:SMP-30/gluconolactonase/LRE family protein [Pseudoruegeria sp. SK021]OSP55915.1 hypothetical protein BV911_04495 [Pseudoruegeria sp. SK021]